jgi:hypothetical protein
MIRVIIFAIVGSLLASCGPEKPPSRRVPDGVLSADSMAFFLSQIHLIDAAMRHREVRKQTLQSYAKKSFILYFDTAAVSRDRFLTSMAFWSEDFEAMSGIYDQAMDRLSTKLAKLETPESAEKDEPDQD